MDIYIYTYMYGSLHIYIYIYMYNWNHWNTGTALVVCIAKHLHFCCVKKNTSMSHGEPLYLG